MVLGRILSFTLPTAAAGLGAGLLVPFFLVCLKLRPGAGITALIFTIT
ncbi:MAG: hypothetical protein QXH42_00780 [Thermoplasmata archaeon]